MPFNIHFWAEQANPTSRCSQPQITGFKAEGAGGQMPPSAHADQNHQLRCWLSCPLDSDEHCEGNMSLLGSPLTMTSGLVYLVLLLWQTGRSGWGWTLSSAVGRRALGCWWRIRYSGLHWGWWPRPWRSGCAIAPLMLAPWTTVNVSERPPGSYCCCVGCWWRFNMLFISAVGAGDDPWLAGAPRRGGRFPLPIRRWSRLRAWLRQG